MNRDNNEQDLNQLNALVDEFGNFGLNNNTPIVRKEGILEKKYMSWQTHLETLFQFKEIYTDRLRSLRQVFHRNSNKTIQDLSNDENICELVGLFKRIEAKRIRAFEPDFQDKYKNNKPIFSQNDTYEIEDETSRVRIQIRNNTKINGSGKFVALQTSYGVIIKCNGDYNAKLNRFIVSNVQTPKPAPQKQMILPKGEPKFMGVYCEPTISDLRKLYQVILKRPLNEKPLDLCQLVIIGGIDLTNFHQASEYDNLIHQISSLIDVYIIPSSSEETSRMYPLNPLPRTLLRKCFDDKKNCGNCSNPQILESRDQNVRLDVFVSCGENLVNLKANCNIKDDLELMKLIIEYRHACPSSAFSLPIFSYNYDPLILASTPHLMIHGKCEKFQSEFWQRNWDHHSVNVRLVGLSKGDFARIDLSSNDLEAILWPFSKNQRIECQ